MKGKILFMKKSTKIILPALAVLVLGTAAAATGTVAWFAANGVVSASGMLVECSTSKNLLISNIDPENSTAAQFIEGSTFGASVETAKTGKKTLSPSSTSTNVLKSETPKFYYVADKISAVSGAALVGAKITEGTEEKNYFVEHDFWLANSAPADMDIAIKSLTATDKDDNPLTKAITKSLRVGVVYNDKVAGANWGKIYTVVEGATTSYQGFIKATETGITTVSTGASVAYEDATGAISEAVTATLASSVIDPASSKLDSMGSIKSTTTAVTDAKGYTWSAVKVFVWYEGQDAACTSNNALSIEEVKLSISFQADAKASA